MEKEFYTAESHPHPKLQDFVFAERLKAIRKSTVNPDTGKPYTQKDLAAKIGISTTAYNGYEHGVMPTVQNLSKLAGVLRCSIDSLVGTVDAGGKVQEMYFLGDVARAFLSIVASDCIAPMNLMEGKFVVTNVRLWEFFRGYFELYNNQKYYPSDTFEALFRRWVGEELMKLDSTPIKTDSQDADTE